MAIVELVPVELIPDFDTLVDVWIVLFGRSERSSVSGICRQFWQAEFPTGVARRATLDLAQQRFPIQVKPLTHPLRAMAGSGLLDTDSLSTANSSHEAEGLSENAFLRSCLLVPAQARMPSLKGYPSDMVPLKQTLVLRTSIIGPSGFLVGPSFQRSQQGKC